MPKGEYQVILKEIKALRKDVQKLAAHRFFQPPKKRTPCGAAMWRAIQKAT
jgi:hypothetical protein